MLRLCLLVYLLCLTHELSHELSLPVTFCVSSVLMRCVLVSPFLSLFLSPLSLLMMGCLLLSSSLSPVSSASPGDALICSVSFSNGLSLAVSFSVSPWNESSVSFSVSSC